MFNIDILNLLILLYLLFIFCIILRYVFYNINNIDNIDNIDKYREVLGGKLKIKLNYEKELPKNEGREVAYWKRKDLQPNKTLKDLFKLNGVNLDDGTFINFSSGISPKEGWYLYNLVLKNKNINKILEVGMANGTSALYMCQALHDSNKKDGSLTSIDPNQSTQWKNVGITQIERASLDNYHNLIQNTSDIAMANLLEEKEKFDMIFIDGMHLFDYTLLDIYYAVKLVKINGIIVIDDIRHSGVKDAIQYVKKNYNMLKYIPDDLSHDTMATFVKIKEDDRKWDFHKIFCYNR